MKGHENLPSQGLVKAFYEAPAVDQNTNTPAWNTYPRSSNDWQWSESLERVGMEQSTYHRTVPKRPNWPVRVWNIHNGNPMPCNVIGHETCDDIYSTPVANWPRAFRAAPARPKCPRSTSRAPPWPFDHLRTECAHQISSGRAGTTSTTVLMTADAVSALKTKV